MYKKGMAHTEPTTAAVQTWLDKTNNGNKRTNELKPGLKQDTIENNTDVRFETYSGTGTDKKLYRQNYIKK